MFLFWNRFLYLVSEIVFCTCLFYMLLITRSNEQKHWTNGFVLKKNCCKKNWSCKWRSGAIFQRGKPSTHNLKMRIPRMMHRTLYKGILVRSSSFPTGYIARQNSLHDPCRLEGNISTWRSMIPDEFSLADRHILSRIILGWTKCTFAH